MRNVQGFNFDLDRQFWAYRKREVGGYSPPENRREARPGTPIFDCSIHELTNLPLDTRLERTGVGSEESIRSARKENWYKQLVKDHKRRFATSVCVDAVLAAGEVLAERLNMRSGESLPVVSRPEVSIDQLSIDSLMAVLEMATVMPEDPEAILGDLFLEETMSADERLEAVVLWGYIYFFDFVWPLLEAIKRKLLHSHKRQKRAVAAIATVRETARKILAKALLQMASWPYPMEKKLELIDRALCRFESLSHG